MNNETTKIEATAYGLNPEDAKCLSDALQEIKRSRPGVIVAAEALPMFYGPRD